MANQFTKTSELPWEIWCNCVFPKQSGIYRIDWYDRGYFYIGKSTNLRSRQLSHLRELRKGKHTNAIIQRLYDKYGHISMHWSVVLFCEKRELSRNEKAILELYWPDPKLVNIKRESQELPKKQQWQKKFVFMNCWSMRPVWFSTKQEAHRVLGWSHERTRQKNFQNHQLDYVFTDSLEKAREYCIQRRLAYAKNGIVWNGVWYTSVSDAYRDLNPKWSLGYFNRLIHSQNIKSDKEHEAWKRKNRNKRGVIFEGKVYPTFEDARDESGITCVSLDHFRRYVKRYGCKTVQDVEALASAPRNGAPIGKEHLFTWGKGSKQLWYRPNCYLVAYVNGRWYPSVSDAIQAIYNYYDEQD